MNMIHSFPSEATQNIDWARFQLIRTYDDRRMVRLLSYYREDAERCVAQADLLARRGALVPLIAQLELLRRDSIQIGALGVAKLAEEIENRTRDMVDYGPSSSAGPTGLSRLRSLLQATLSEMDAEISQPVSGLQTSR